MAEVEAELDPKAARVEGQLRLVVRNREASPWYEVVLRASQVPHQGDLGNLRMQMGEGVTGWVAQQKSVVALPSNASTMLASGA